MLRRMNLDESFALLETMIRRIQQEGSLVFVAGLEGLPLLAPVGKRYFEAAKNTGSVLIPDVLKGILGKPELMADGIHPNAAGYRVMAEPHRESDGSVSPGNAPENILIVDDRRLSCRRYWTES